MHLEILVEGISDKRAIDILIDKIIKKNLNTWTIISHLGCGKIPRDLDAEVNPKDRTLLHQLPKKLRAYEEDKKNNLLVVVLVDCDDKNCKEFKKKLLGIAQHCCPNTKIIFRIAIEELEAWFLGDQNALRKAYPEYNKKKLNSYVQDSPCDTWKFLANVIGTEISMVRKKKWAENISPHMDVEKNESPSFRCFRDGIRNMVAKHEKPFSSRPSA